MGSLCSLELLRGSGEQCFPELCLGEGSGSALGDLRNQSPPCASQHLCDGQVTEKERGRKELWLLELENGAKQEKRRLAPAKAWKQELLLCSKPLTPNHCILLA